MKPKQQLDTASVERMLGMGPIPGDTPVEEVACWLKAKREDLEAQLAQEDRVAGMVPLADYKLFMRVLRPFGDDASLGEAMQILGTKKRPGHKQRQALELWDRYYKGKTFHVSGDGIHFE